MHARTFQPLTSPFFLLFLSLKGIAFEAGIKQMGLCEHQRFVSQHLGLNTVRAHYAALYHECAQEDKDTNRQLSWNRRIHQGHFVRAVCKSNVCYLHEVGVKTMILRLSIGTVPTDYFSSSSIISTVCLNPLVVL